MRRSIVLGLAGLGLLAGCKGNWTGHTPQVSPQAQQDPVKAAQGQSADALSRAHDAQKDAQRKQDEAQSAQKDVADAQKKLTEAEAKAQQTQQQAQASQQKALTEGQQAAQVATQASQQAAQGQAAQAAQFQAQQKQFAQSQGGSAQAQQAQQGAPTPPALANAAQGQDTTATESGKLSQVTASSVVIDRGDKGQLPISADGSTQVVIDGRQAALTDLKPGTDVRVAYQNTAGSPVKAQRIEATSTSVAPTPDSAGAATNLPSQQPKP